MEAAEKLQQIKDDLRPWHDLMLTACNQVIDQDISRYPILVVHPATVEIGIPLVEKGKVARWSIHISTLEEFATKQLIFPEKIDDFRAVYKQHDQHYCLFILSDLGAQFVYMPYYT